MDAALSQHLANLYSKDKELRYASFQYVLDVTRDPVDWAYAVWDDLLKLTTDGDNHQRTIAVQLLSSLAKSDTERRLLHDFATLLHVTRDKQFVTARHSLQCLWKIGIVNKEYCNLVMEGLSNRFEACSTEKNCTLIRYDIIEVLRKIYDHTSDADVRATAIALMEKELDEKYRKKYMGVWKDVLQKCSSTK